MAYGFAGLDYPIPQTFHSHFYYFIMWIVNLMIAVSMQLLYYILTNWFISIFKAVGKLYFRLCSFLMCGSNAAEIGF
jgi:hypothetical protein